MTSGLSYLFGFIQICALAIILVQLQSLKKSLKNTHQLKCKQATFKYVNGMNQRHKKSLYHFDKKHGMDEVIPLSSYSDGDLYTVSVYLNDIEQLCGGVSTNLYDYETLKRNMASKLVNDYFRFENFINNERDSRNWPLHYRNFECMVKRLKKDKALPP